MDYKPLKIVKFMNKGENEEVYLQRFNSFGTIKANLFPYLVKHGEFKTKRFELFSVPLEEIQILSQEIVENSNRIKDLAASLPVVAQQGLYKDQLYKAIISTDEIEGIKTTRKEVSIAHKALQSKSKEQIRLLSTVRLYNDIQENAFLIIDKLQTIRAIYDELTEGEIAVEDRLDGQLFRNEPVSVIDSGSQKTDHVPPMSEDEISQMLTAWIQFINNRRVPFLIKAMLAHYFFENVHPFYDGNGRTGRYILARYLVRKLDIYSGLLISQKINENRRKYYKAFKTTGDADNKAEGTFFVLALLELLHDGQLDLIEMLEEKKASLKAYEEKIKASYSPLQVQILLLILQSQVFLGAPEENITDNEIMDNLKGQFPRSAIKREIDQLERGGVIRLTGNRPKRHEVGDGMEHTTPSIRK